MTLLEWLEGLRKSRKGRVERIPLNQSREWLWDNGVVRHRSGGFFSIEGVKVARKGTAFDGWTAPMIRQPEIGLLGFLRHEDAGGAHYLLQGKSEPGSVDWVQAGPSVQATRSNYMRLHKGAATRYLDLFRANSASAGQNDGFAGILQSEQGTRFIQKYNGNAVVTLEEPIEPEDEAWRWFPASELRAALAKDFSVNTDARSVLVSAPWRDLAEGRQPFAATDGFAAESDSGLRSLRDALAHSHAQGASRLADGELDQVLGRLQALRGAAAPVLRKFPLEALSGWREAWGDRPPQSDKGPDSLGYGFFRVEAPGREVEQWDQPFLLCEERPTFALLLWERRGLPVLGFSWRSEPGFGSLVQLGVSLQSDTPLPVLGELLEGRKAELEVIQSDEGGRFFNAIGVYQLHDLRDHSLPQEAEQLVWLNLAQVEVLCRRPGVLTNEARSALSVLLSLL